MEVVGLGLRQPHHPHCITVRGVKGRERNRKKSHLLLLDPSPIHITPFLFKQKGRGRERGEKGGVEGKGE